MSQLTLTKLRLENGIWDGLVTGATEPPRLDVRHLDQPVDGVSVTQDGSGWAVRIPVPAAAVTEGVNCILIFDTETGAKLGDITLIAGEPAADDLRAEIELLRAELDTLKRAFRRHCTEA